MTDRTRPPDHHDAPPPRDELDDLLRRWHADNRDRAASARTALMDRIAAESADAPQRSTVDARSDHDNALADSRSSRRRALVAVLMLRRFAMHRMTHLAASLVVLVALATLLLPVGDSGRLAAADDIIMVPEGGRLDALDERGGLIGPCPLEHTDVDVEISGHFTRVNVSQRYTNPYDETIEAVYTFPLSHRAAVDRMTMTVGDRVIEGEVRQRDVARQVYESARDQGHVASLLEQERPNIFTQSVANIEPGAEVVIEISYVEVLESVDGEYRFDFPMVVAPRYTPGSPTGAASRPDPLPDHLENRGLENRGLEERGLDKRRGVVLRGPATLEAQMTDDMTADALPSSGVLYRLLRHAVPIHQPPQWTVDHDDLTDAPVATVRGVTRRGHMQQAQLSIGNIDGVSVGDLFYIEGARSQLVAQARVISVSDESALADLAYAYTRDVPAVEVGMDVYRSKTVEDGRRTWTEFTARYADDAKEAGVIYDDGTGVIGGRWFLADLSSIDDPAGGFASPTDQVPDADRVTPMPNHPEHRAGHDISVSVSIDTGGPGIREIRSESHDIVRDDHETRDDGMPRRTTVSLDAGRDIPNRDFRLKWSLTSESIEEAIFTHTGDYGDGANGFFTLILQPPDRVDDADVRPRELIFVLDNSGSMRGRRAILDEGGTSALDAAKDVLSQAIDTMRPSDRFNVISFNHTLDTLWDEPQPNSAENRGRAQQYVEDRQGGGGTEMRNAVYRALHAGPFADLRESDRRTSITPMQLANLPADGREVRVTTPMSDIRLLGQVRHADGCDRQFLLDAGGVQITLESQTTFPDINRDEDVILSGQWVTRGGHRLFKVRSARFADEADDDDPMRIVLFVTDGLVSNDAAIIDAVRRHAHETRMFTIGMSQAPNRHLLDEMARVGRGASDYVLPGQDVEPIVGRFADRIATPVLTDIELDFDGLSVSDVRPSAEHLPDLFDVQPLVIHGRYDEAGEGALTIGGRTGAGRYERTIDLTLPEREPRHDTIATLWARQAVAEHMREGEVDRIVELGERFSIMTQHTSFVAVEKQRVVIDGEARLVRVPIEYPKDMSWEGVFGDDQVRAANQHDAGGFRRRSTVDRSANGVKLSSELLPVQPAPAPRAPAEPMTAPSAAPAEAEPAEESGPFRSSGRGGGGGGGFGGGGGGGSVGGSIADVDRRDGHARERQAIDRRRVHHDTLRVLELSDSDARGGAAVYSITIPPIDDVDMAMRLEAALSSDGRFGEQAGVVLNVERYGAVSIGVVEPLRSAISRHLEELGEPSQSEAQRRRAFEALIDAIEQHQSDVQRDLVLRRRLAPELRAMLDADEGPETLHVSVLLVDVSDESVDAVEQAGLSVVDVAGSRWFVVGRIERDRLVDLALADPVRRVEPVQ